MAAAPFKEAKIFTLLGQSFVEVRCFKNHFTVAEKRIVLDGSRRTKEVAKLKITIESAKKACKDPSCEFGCNNRAFILTLGFQIRSCGLGFIS